MKRDFAQVLNDQVAAHEEDRAERRSIAVNFPHSLYSLVARAARERDMTMTGYMRRAALAMAQADVPFDWAEEMQAEPALLTAESKKRGLGGTVMVGTGFGSWKITGLETHGTDD